MTQRTDYPFEAFRMLPTGKVQKVLAVKTPCWDRSMSAVEGSKGEWVKRSDLFDSIGDCIVDGENKLNAREHKLIAQLSNVTKARVALEKAR